MSLDLTHSELLKKGDAFSIKVIEGFKFDMLAGKIQLVFSDKCKKNMQVLPTNIGLFADLQVQEITYLEKNPYVEEFVVSGREYNGSILWRASY
ncbi:hypothetical protein [Enterococcus bulliens]